MPFSTGTVITNAGLAIASNLLSGVGGTVPKWLGVGSGATGAARTAVKADTALSAPVGSRVGTNAPTRQTTTVTNDTVRLQQTYTHSGAAAAIDEAGIFDASTSGNMFISATFGVNTLGDGDSLQLTYDIVLA